MRCKEELGEISDNSYFCTLFNEDGASMKVFFRTLLILCACTTLWAQDDQLDEFTIDDVPDEKATPYFGIGGGFIASFNFVNLDEVNLLLNQVLPGKKLDAPMVMLGAQG